MTTFVVNGPTTLPLSLLAPQWPDDCVQRAFGESCRILVLCSPRCVLVSATRTFLTWGYQNDSFVMEHAQSAYLGRSRLTRKPTFAGCALLIPILNPRQSA